MFKKLNSYIQEENSRHAEEVKEVKRKIAATKSKGNRNQNAMLFVYRYCYVQNNSMCLL